MASEDIPVNDQGGPVTSISLRSKKDIFLNELKQKKKKLREKYRRRRDAFFAQLDGASRNLSFRRPPSPLAKLVERVRVVAFYHSLGSEAPTHRLTEFFDECGKTIAFPVVEGAKPLVFRKVTSLNMLEAGYQNIPEPGNDCEAVSPDLIITPLLAFDRSMRRLGQGAGHYDRTFKKFPNATRVGLAWSVQEADNLPTESHDVPLHMIVTESEIIQSSSLTS